jgi:GNAT superfamily N-acetyltransferase
MQIRSRQAADRPAVPAFLAQRGHARAARLGELVDPLDCPALISEAEDGRLLGVLTYVVDRDQCEILTLHTAEQWQGVGTALVEAVERLAARQGCRRLWLITTNDNLDACASTSGGAFALPPCTRARWTTAGPA